MKTKVNSKSRPNKVTTKNLNGIVTKPCRTIPTFA